MNQTYLKTLLLCLCLLAGVSTFAYDAEIDGICYNFSGNQATVTHNNYNSYSKYSGSVSIPSSVTYNGTTYSVTSIGDQAFYLCSDLTGVSIPGSVTSIGSNAFYNCSSLTYVHIPNSVTSIGNSAFANCSGLTSIVIPNSVTFIGSSAFIGCYIAKDKFVNNSSLTNYSNWGANLCDQETNDGLLITSNSVVKCRSWVTSANIPYGVVSIGFNAFQNCRNLTSVSIPSSVTNIASNAFKDCSSLTYVNIPGSVKSIESSLFQNCTSLTSISIPSSVTRIGTSAFSGCAALTSITIPSSVTSIGSSAFSGCTGLTSFTIPSGVKIIESSTFNNCINLSSIAIPGGVTSIKSGAFNGCRSLASINIPGGVTSIEQSVFSNCTSLKSITIPDNVTSIGHYAFSDCTGLTSITIPSSVTSLGMYVFRGCTNLASVTVSGNITSIGAGTFTNCKSLSSFIVPNTVTSIGDQAFNGCSDLTSVVIPDGVTSIGSSAFAGCILLTSIVIPSSVTSIGNSAFKDCCFTSDFFVNQSGLTSDDNWGALLCDDETKDGLIIKDDIVVKCRDWASSVIIPNYVKGIGAEVFRGKTNLTSVVIAGNVKSIGDYAFNGCSGLTSVVIPNSVTDIGNYAFNNCQNLADITIGSGVTSLGDFPFLGTPWYRNLPEGMNYIGKIAYKYNGQMPEGTKITIKAGTTSIHGEAFHCDGLTSVTIPNSVTSIGDGAFRGCNNLTSVNIPSSVTSIGNNVFEGCSKLNSITLPSNLTSIGSRLLCGCSGLTSITIPSSVTNIGWGAFEGCSGLTSITIPSSVTNIGWNAFSRCYIKRNAFTNYSALTNISDWGLTLYDEETDDGLIIDGQTIVKCREWATAVTIPANVKAIGAYAFSGCGGITSLAIPEDIDSIGNSAFLACSGLTSIVLPKKLRRIEPSTFIRCQNLTSVTLPDSLMAIGDYAFGECSSLTSAIFPAGLREIGSGAFSGCNGITSVTIPEKVDSISNAAFANCPGLASITVASGNHKYDSRDNCNAIIDKYSNTLIAGCKNTVIPGTVESIGNQAFFNCKGLTSITIPDNIKAIGQYAFHYCTDLTSATIGSGVASISNNAFEGCSSLSSVNIPNSVTSIEASAFYGCSSLASVTIPPSVTFIDYNAFSNIPNLLIISDSENPASVSYYNNGGAFALRGTPVIVPESAVEKYKTALGWKDLSINSGFRVVETTQTTITLSTPSSLSGQSVQLSGSDYYPNEEGMLTITGLSPDKTYQLDTRFKYGNTYYKGNTTAQTRPVKLELSRVATNSSITVKGSYKAGDATIVRSGFEGIADADEYTLSGLPVNSSRAFTYYIVCSDGSRFQETATFSTVPISVMATAFPGASSCTLSGKCSGIIDAEISSYGFKDCPSQMEVKVTGLDPQTIYTQTFTINFQDGTTISRDVSFMTKPISLTTQMPKVISAGNVIVAAESNLDDEETNVGFEWRRTDWPDDFPSNTGGAYLYEGTMEGYIRNLYYLERVLWRYRPYYQANSGNKYYGEWVGIDPTNTNYFEPTVRTYAQINVKGNRAEVKGYAMRGTDRVTKQGFMYWENTASYSLRRRGASIPSNAVTIEVKGTVMTAVLEDLEYETQYCCVAFATTEEDETFFGEVQTFSTAADPDGIREVKSEELKVGSTYYDLNGRKLDKPQKGINIIRYSDGTSRKLLLK